MRPYLGLFVSLFVGGICWADAKPTVIVEQAQLQELHDTLSYPALTVPEIHASVSAESDGVVTSIFAPLGRAIKKGDPLVSIRNTDPVYQYAPATVRASVSGVISKVDISVGQRVNRGQSILSIIDPKRVIIRIELSATDSRRLRVGDFGFLYGQQIPLSGEAKGLKVRVKGISPFLDPATGTASCDLSLEVPSVLPPGLIGRVEFKTNARKGFLVSEQAVYYKGSQPYLRFIDQGRVKLTQVNLGKTNAGRVEVLKGLQPEQKIITKANQFVSEGMEVNAAPADGKSQAL